MSTQETQEMRNLHQRLHAVMRDVGRIAKDGKLSFGKGPGKPYASHDAITSAVRPALIEHGVLAIASVESWEQDGTRTAVVMDLCFVNVDDPADTRHVKSLGYGVCDSDKGPGKAISYATKYALLKALMLETGEDADHENIPHTPAQRPRAEQPAPPDKDREAKKDAALRIKYAAARLDMDNDAVLSEAIKCYGRSCREMNTTQITAFAAKLESRAALAEADEQERGQHE